MEKNCLKCNKLFYKKQTTSKKEWSTSKYCSHSCSNSVNSLGNRGCVGRVPWNKGLKLPKGENLISLFCKECMAIYKVRKYRENISHFCSTICRQQNMNEGKTPINKLIRLSLAYKAWRTLVFERDNYTCQECGIKNGLGKTIYLHADHIKPFAFFPELRFEVSNGRTLCVPCHRKTPTYGVGAWRKLQALAQEV